MISNKIKYFNAEWVVAVYIVRLCRMLGSLSYNLGNLSFKLSDHVRDSVIHDYLLFHDIEKFVRKKPAKVAISEPLDLKISHTPRKRRLRNLRQYLSENFIPI